MFTPLTYSSKKIFLPQFFGLLYNSCYLEMVLVLICSVNMEHFIVHEKILLY